VATFYKKKDEVKLKPGQTLGFTAGKGYYAAGTPTPPKPPPSSTASKTPAAAPTATRPVAAKTPTTPASIAKKPAPAPRKPEDRDPEDDTTRRGAPVTASKPAAPKINLSTPFYTKPGDVPLLPSQTIAHSDGNGFFAAGRPNPTKAPTSPRSSTAKVTAVSTKASTESPLVEHRETRNGRTTVTLSHRAKPEGKPASKPVNAASRNHRTSVPTHPGSTRPRTEGPQGHIASGHHGPLGWLEGAGSSLVHLGEEGAKFEVSGAKTVVHDTKTVVVHGVKKVVHAVEGGAKREVSGAKTVVRTVKGSVKVEVRGATRVVHAGEHGAKVELVGVKKVGLAFKGGLETEFRGLKEVVHDVGKHPGTALEITFLAAQFVPGVDGVVDVTVASVGGAANAALGVWAAAQGLNAVTGHFTVHGAVVDAVFTFPAGFPDLTEDEASKGILKVFGAAVGATGVGIGFAVDKLK
jgi:hypothetical protein